MAARTARIRAWRLIFRICLTSCLGDDKINATKRKETMMNEILQKMIRHADYEVVYLGENFNQRRDDYLGRLEALGYSSEVAEAGMAAFAQHIVDEADQGHDLPKFYYIDDAVAQMAVFCYIAAA